MSLPQVPQNISDEIFHILTKEDNAALIDRITAEHAINKDRIANLSAVIGHAVMGTVPLKGLAQTVSEELTVEIEKAKKIAVSILLTILYPYWPLFPDIDDAVTSLGGKVPTEKPAMPREQLTTDDEQLTTEEVVYPKIQQTTNPQPELLGGLEIPAPPAPRGARLITNSSQLTTGLERDIPWQPQINTPPQTPPYQGGGGTRNVARPGDVAKLLEKNLLKTNEDANSPDPRVKGNVVDLSQ